MRHRQGAVYCAACLLISLLLCGCIGQAPSPEVTLDRFRAEQKSLMHEHLSPDEAKKEFVAFSGSLSDADVTALEGYALSPEGLPAAFAFLYPLVDHRRFDTAATLVITSMLDVPEDREYRMWKWWETFLGERPDYMQLTRQFSESLLKEYAMGNLARRQVVAQLLGRPAGDAVLTPADFRRATGIDKVKDEAVK